MATSTSEPIECDWSGDEEPLKIPDDDRIKIATLPIRSKREPLKPGNCFIDTDYETLYPVTEHFQSKTGQRFSFQVFPGSVIPESAINNAVKMQFEREMQMEKVETLREDDLYGDFIDDERTDLDIKETETGFVYHLRVPRSLYGAIIGKNGSILRKLQADTNTCVTVEEEGNAPVEISATSAWNIERCVAQIEMILLDARNEQPFTHFFSIPVTGKDVQAGFERFRREVLTLEKGSDNNLDESIFQNPSKLHLTIGTLVLLDESEEREAVRALTEFQIDILDALKASKEPYVIEVRGIDYMNDDPSEVDVLYAEAAFKSGKIALQDICDKLVERFVARGLMFEKYDKVKLHITLMNSIFRMRQGKTSERASFDARRILERFRNYYFGTQPFDHIHISCRQTTKSGYYKPLHVVLLNE